MQLNTNIFLTYSISILYSCGIFASDIGERMLHQITQDHYYGNKNVHEQSSRDNDFNFDYWSAKDRRKLIKYTLIGSAVVVTTTAILSLINPFATKHSTKKIIDKKQKEIIKNIDELKSTISNTFLLTNNKFETLQKESTDFFENIVQKLEEQKQKVTQFAEKHEDLINEHIKNIDDQKELINKHELSINEYQILINDHEQYTNKHQELINQSIQNADENANQIKEISAQMNDISSKLEQINTGNDDLEQDFKELHLILSTQEQSISTLTKYVTKKTETSSTTNSSGSGTSLLKK